MPNAETPKSHTIRPTHGYHDERVYAAEGSFNGMNTSKECLQTEDD